MALSLLRFSRLCQRLPFTLPPILMPKRQTAQIASADLMQGDSLYLERARKTLPYLVRQAHASNTIFYSSLAQEVGMPNARNLNYVLGAIGNALRKLEKREKVAIPPIQCLVVNMRDGLPGEGIGDFITADFSSFTKTQKKKLVDVRLADVYTYPHWDWVLEKFGLAPLPVKVQKLVAKAKRYQHGGESKEHKALKAFVAANPTAIGLRAGLPAGETEYALPSADKIDVVFQDRGLQIGIEVKSRISDTADILRGLFQCVKYRYLLEAEQVVNGKIPNSRVLLVLQSQLPRELLPVQHTLGIEVIEDISPTT